MEKQQKTAPAIEVQQPSIETEKVVNCKQLSELINFQLQNNPDLAGKTKMDIAKECQHVAVRAGAKSVSAYIKVVYRPEGEILTIDGKVSKHHPA